MENKLFKFTIEIKPTEDSVLNEPIVGGYIDCYAGETNVEEALKKCVYELVNNKYFIFENVLNDPEIVNLELWDKHIEDNWNGEFEENFPTSQEIRKITENGELFFSPIVGYLKE